MVEVAVEGIGKPRQIAFDQLALQGQRRGGHHDGGVVFLRVADRRHEVRQGLAGAGARLHREVAGRVQRLGHRRGHAFLAGAPAAAQPRYGGGE